MAAPQLSFSAFFTSFFGEDGNPRHCQIVGNDTYPFVSLEIRTPTGAHSTHTSISGQIGNLSPVATIDWVSDGHLGTVHIHGQDIHTADLVTLTNQPNSRGFELAGPDGVTYHYMWSRAQPGLYMLYVYLHPQLAPSHIATYQQVHDSVGRTFGSLRYGFVDNHLFLHAMIALILNWWMDRTVI